MLTLPTLLLSLAPAVGASPGASVAAFAASFAAGSGDAVSPWPDYRGPGLDGVAAGSPPLSWGESENVRWRTPLPGRGWSTPVVAGGRAWMTTATPQGDSLSLLVVELESGELVVERELFRVEEPQECNQLNSYASPSPVVTEDGQRVVVTFGYGGTACLDVDTSEVIWERRDLVVDHMEGPGSSPFVHDGRIHLHFDGGDEQFVVALDPGDGRTLWRAERSIDLEPISADRRKAYSTPVVVRQGDVPVLISCAAEGTYGYDARSGEELWIVRHKGFSNAPRPLVAHGQLYVTTGFMKPSLLALRPGTERVAEPEVAWSWTRGVPTMPSPVATQGGIWFVSDGGVATCLEPATGKERWRGRVGADTSSSPVLASGHLFFFDRNGRTTVIRPGDEPTIVGENQLGEGFMACPIVLGDSWLLRGKRALYRIEEPAGG